MERVNMQEDYPGEKVIYNKIRIKRLKLYF